MINQMLEQIEALHKIDILDTEVIILDTLVKGLGTFGYKDYQRPKARKNFDFNKLDVKSIRIMNRLT